ncbi:MAG TPA: MgtC/SapB family protein [Clostridia bacterium]|nr:MgtC/SapB family protein [Clostridia bacterium]
MFESLSTLDIALRIGLTILAGGVIGYEREHKNRPAGLRTHILVCLGAAIVALIECTNTANVLTLGESAAAVSVGRMAAQVVSGIGFLGAGTIMVNKRNVAGLTTAASLWNVACLGLAAGMGYYKICLIGTACTLVVLSVIKQVIVVHVSKQLEVVFVERKETLEFLNDYFEEHHIKVHDVDFNMTQQDNVNTYTNTYTLELPHKSDYVNVVNDLSEYANILRVRTMDV